MITESKCSVCKNTKTIEHFSIRRATGRPRSECLQCMRDYVKKRYALNPYKYQRIAKKNRKDNPERDRKYHIKTTYGITVEEFQILLEKQNYRCAICGTKEPKGPGKNFCVDHNHITGKIRGLLCYACNVSLGILKEDVSIMIKAIIYLTNNK